MRLIKREDSVRLVPQEDRALIKAIRAIGVRESARRAKCSPSMMTRVLRGEVVMSMSLYRRITDVAKQTGERQ